jgi:hypothetical protein
MKNLCSKPAVDPEKMGIKMASFSTNFHPLEQGFHFTNSFEFNFKLGLPLANPIHLKDIFYGLCGGMCFTALDYFNAGLPIPSFTEVDRLPPELLSYLHRRQLDSLNLPVIPKVIEWMLRSDLDVSRLTACSEVPKLRIRLKDGQPVVLGLIRVHTGKSPTENHQVLATGYDIEDQTNALTIHLYDPNHPAEEPTLLLDISQPSQGLSIRQSTGEALRAFFVINYKERKPPFI